MFSRNITFKPKCCINNYEKKRNELKKSYYSVKRPITINEMNLHLSPLFSNTCLDVNIIKNKVVINIINKPQIFSDTCDVIDLINEWNMHDIFRKFMIKSLTNANKNNIYRYKPNITWICPLNVYYVFDENI